MEPQLKVAVPVCVLGGEGPTFLMHVRGRISLSENNYCYPISGMIGRASAMMEASRESRESRDIIVGCVVRWLAASCGSDTTSGRCLLGK